MSKAWTPSFSLDSFNKSMDNAFRRVSGSIGADLSRDLGNTRQLKNTAADIVRSNLDHPYQPTFMRLGSAALSAASYRPGGTVDLKECAGDILIEFYEEGCAALLAAKAELRSGALEHLKAAGFDDVHCAAILDAADNVFSMPEKDAFSKEAAPFASSGMAPSTKASLAGIGAFVPAIVLLRHPLIAGFIGICAATLAYYLSRNAERNKVEYMLRQLPRQLYDMLLSGLQSSARRYGDVVNATAKKG